MKSKASTQAIRAASVSYMIVTLIIESIVLVIQKMFGLTLTSLKITTLNIFKSGDLYLGVIDLQLFFKVLLIGIVYYYTSKLSKRSAFIWSFVALIILLVYGFLGAYISNILK